MNASSDPPVTAGESALLYGNVTELSPQAAGLPQRRRKTAGSSPEEALAPRSDAVFGPNSEAVLPKRGDPALPRRTAVSWRVGRHRSLHRISVASDAPVLVLAVAGRADGACQELAEHVAEATAESCPGVAITIAYLPSVNASPTGRQSAVMLTDALSDALTSAPGAGGRRAPCAVVVPLLAGPHPVFDSEIDAAVAQAAGQVMLATHLGPHPLLAGALHDRLSEAGLARAGRALGLNVSLGANGVLVVADRGQRAVSDAGLTAVLLAARLAVPAAPASLGDQASIDAAVERLREAGATHLAVAPCVIGPESAMTELEQLSSALGGRCAPPLGAHPAIAQLVAVRYGEALARISVESH